MRSFVPFVTTTILVVGCWAVPHVKIGKTTFVGRDITGLQQDFFGGIPFAEPPLGNLRLRPPVLKTHLDRDTFNASNFGPACLQPGVPIPLASEDCLTINIFRPSHLPTHTKLPVLFWTYGGGFVAGFSGNFNGSAIVAQSVARGTPLIYVNFNYRLGPLGFAQGQEADDLGMLNIALKDELAALEWVQHNIGAFGGDKTKVTIFGESAGAIMTSVLFLNSPIHKLARAAIFQSGSSATSLTFRAARREGNWENFVAGVASCASKAKSGHTFDCLRNTTTDEILAGVLNSLGNAPEEFPYEPTFDGPRGLYPDLSSKLLARGHFAKLPFISGTNLDEGTLFIPPTMDSEARLREFFTANFSPPLVQPSQLVHTVDRLLQLYPDIPALGSPFNTGNETFGLSSQVKRAAALEGDIAFLSQRRIWQQTAAKAGVKTWGYLFNQPQPQGRAALGVAHGEDLPYVYGAPQDRSPSSLRLSTLIIDYWVSFATSLNPNDGKGTQRPIWEHYTPHNEHVIQLNGDNMTMIADTFRKQQTDFINSVPVVFLHRR